MKQQVANKCTANQHSDTNKTRLILHFEASDITQIKATTLKFRHALIGNHTKQNL